MTTPMGQQLYVSDNHIKVKTLFLLFCICLFVIVFVFVHFYFCILSEYLQVKCVSHSLGA